MCVFAEPLDDLTAASEYIPFFLEVLAFCPFVNLAAADRGKHQHGRAQTEDFWWQLGPPWMALFSGSTSGRWAVKRGCERDWMNAVGFAERPFRPFRILLNGKSLNRGSMDFGE
jgi:hypothetical protein